MQPNTFAKGDEVELRVYEASNEGIIQSWARGKVKPEKAVAYRPGSRLRDFLVYHYYPLTR